jgi:NADPH:quinone reductase-like Zn-dependent oxidoreductase
MSGEVIDVDENVERWSVGSMVTALTNDVGYADYGPVDARHCLHAAS